MKETLRDEINEIVESITSSIAVSEIYLFGSHAKGNAREDSDFDFYVVIPNDSELRELEASRVIRKGLRDVRKRSIDMFVGKQEKFDRRKDYFYSLEQEVKDTGVRLYG